MIYMMIYESDRKICDTCGSKGSGYDYRKSFCIICKKRTCLSKGSTYKLEKSMNGKIIFYLLCRKASEFR